MTLKYLIIALAIFVALRFLSRIVNSVQANKVVHRILLRSFPIAEFTIWIGFAIWVLNEIFSEHLYYNQILIVVLGLLILIAGWYFIRDFIAGIILKTEIPFEKNQLIRTPKAEGILKKLGYRSIELESQNGERIKIPYSQLASNSIHLQNIDEGMQGHETTIQVSSSAPIQEVKDKITKEIMLLPWSSIVHMPTIKVVEQTQTHNTYSVHFHTLSERHAAFISQHLKNFF
ncbi:MAG TPA: mechanosensitive ion channel [Tenuifilaceae bacterium]|nr:mechanosensitive ion channel [Tenuifilaceae bacterium]HPE18570.1 mechanosensitive ion channel [Tenuifilaceae bacterium]HPJ46111.1 mechanosensitive ion channel [Tenuifilaceae bacterium]HPQ34404.1 mechanosensitive ion channel [Tenuifilaceae bacterium]